jgi:hypothetical protein
MIKTRKSHIYNYLQFENLKNTLNQDVLISIVLFFSPASSDCGTVINKCKFAVLAVLVSFS